MGTAHISIVIAVLVFGSFSAVADNRSTRLESFEVTDSFDDIKRNTEQVSKDTVNAPTTPNSSPLPPATQMAGKAPEPKAFSEGEIQYQCKVFGEKGRSKKVVMASSEEDAKTKITQMSTGKITELSCTPVVPSRTSTETPNPATSAPRSPSDAPSQGAPVVHSNSPSQFPAFCMKEVEIRVTGGPKFDLNIRQVVQLPDGRAGRCYLRDHNYPHMSVNNSTCFSAQETRLICWNRYPEELRERAQICLDVAQQCNLPNYAAYLQRVLRENLADLSRIGSCAQKDGKIKRRCDDD